MENSKGNKRMNSGFAAVVETIQKLTQEEQQELYRLLQKYLAEARRDEIHKNYLDSQARLQRGELKFSENINELRTILGKE